MSKVQQITSRDNPLLLRLRKLAGDPGAYRKLGEICIEGDHLCRALVDRGGVPSHALVTQRGWESPALQQLALRADSIAVIADALMAGISTLESPSAIAFVLPWAGAKPLQPTAPSVVLDRLQDAGNVGAVLRCASAFGFTQVIALRGTAALWSTKVLRAGMGAHFGLNLVEGVSQADLATFAMPLLATSSHAARAIHQVKLPWPCAWVLGHEGQGVSRGLLDLCQQTLRIAQPGGEESLNVAAAAAVCLYESARQRATA